MNGPIKIITNSDTPKISMIKGRILTDNEIATLNELNNKYAHVIIGGKHLIVAKVDCSINGTKLAFGPIQSFHNYFTHKSTVANMNRGTAWTHWEHKAFYENGIGFYPDITKSPKGCYNLFESWKCKSKQGDCTFIIQHIKNILCNGNEDAGHYFIQWLAHIFQHPDKKPTVAIFLKSVEGTGKGSLFRLLQRILGVHASQINGSQLVTRNFNSILISKLLIFADEVNLMSSDTFDKIKGLISEPICQLEKKGVEAEPMANLARFIFASNHEEVFPAGKRERRFLLIEASSEKANDREYWKEFNRLINNGEFTSAFLHYLLNMDLTDFDPFNAPMTKELIEQKISNFSMVDEYFYEELNTESPFNNEKRTPSTILMKRFIEWIKAAEYQDNKGLKVKDRAARSLLAKKLIKLGFKKIGLRADRNGGIYYETPNIQILRKTFAEEHGLTDKDLF
ncbi:DUF5906 domain-containing protein [Psychromonas arctica]|uniref:DUF5906 domain-containing protein n=1 Tax=Psychromonas arctica TaxID=168275 RepID=UPI0004048D13|nr:DUF5906 domain-containing protein [Psychromonas arctica]